MSEDKALKVFHVFRRHDLNEHMSSGHKLLATFRTFKEARHHAKRSLIKGDQEDYETYREGRCSDKMERSKESHVYLDDKKDDKRGIQDFCIETTDCEDETERIWVEEGLVEAYREPTDDEAEDEDEQENVAHVDEAAQVVGSSGEKDSATEATEKAAGDTRTSLSKETNDLSEASSNSKRSQGIEAHHLEPVAKRPKEVIEIDSSSDEE